MLPEVEFEDAKEFISQQKLLGPVTPQMVSLLIKIGIVKDEKQGRFFLVCVIILSAVFVVFFLEQNIASNIKEQNRLNNINSIARDLISQNQFTPEEFQKKLNEASK